MTDSAVPPPGVNTPPTDDLLVEIDQIAPYYSDDLVTLYHGRVEDVLPTLGQFDACVTDPPYGQTSLEWDRWPSGWPDLVAEHTSSLWCFGTFRMFLTKRDEFTNWKLSQDVVWDKVIASSVVTDRFRRRHEIAAHFYRGAWGEIHHDLPKVVSDGPGRRSTGRPVISAGRRVYGGFKDGSNWTSDGTRYLHSVLRFKREDHRGRINQTQKSPDVVVPLLEYACPPGGAVLDIFAGSASTGVAARRLGLRSVLIERREEQCEKAATRLAAAAQDLFGGARA